MAQPAAAAATAAKADPRIAAATAVAQRAAPEHRNAGGGDPGTGTTPAPAGRKPRTPAAPAGRDSKPSRSGRARAALPRLRPPQLVHDGAGVVLAVITWCWVVLPYLRGGTSEVKRVLYAKFLNRTPDGRDLP